jgi:Flp pilus assembly protein TadG
MSPRKHRAPQRSAATVVEFAILLPVLCFFFAVALDYARIFYFGITVQNCARNGAYYASDYPNNNYIYNNIYGYTSLADAVTRDAGDLSPTPTWTVGYGTSPSGPFTASSSSATNGGGYVQVTVNWTMTSLTSLPGIPSTVTVSRSCVMQIAPAEPNFSN